MSLAKCIANILLHLATESSCGGIHAGAVLFADAGCCLEFAVFRLLGLRV